MSLVVSTDLLNNFMYYGTILAVCFGFYLYRIIMSSLNFMYTTKRIDQYSDVITRHEQLIRSVGANTNKLLDNVSYDTYNAVYQTNRYGFFGKLVDYCGPALNSFVVSSIPTLTSFVNKIYAQKNIVNLFTKFFDTTTKPQEKKCYDGIYEPCRPVVNCPYTSDLLFKPEPKYTDKYFSKVTKPKRFSCPKTRPYYKRKDVGANPFKPTVDLPQNLFNFTPCSPVQPTATSLNVGPCNMTPCNVGPCNVTPCNVTQPVPTSNIDPILNTGLNMLSGMLQSYLTKPQTTNPTTNFGDILKMLTVKPESKPQSTNPTNNLEDIFKILTVKPETKPEAKPEAKPESKSPTDVSESLPPQLRDLMKSMLGPDAYTYYSAYLNKTVGDIKNGKPLDVNQCMQDVVKILSNKPPENKISNLDINELIKNIETEFNTKPAETVTKAAYVDGVSPEENGIRVFGTDSLRDSTGESHCESPNPNKVDNEDVYTKTYFFSSGVDMQTAIKNLSDYEVKGVDMTSLFGNSETPSDPNPESTSNSKTPNQVELSI